MGAAKRKVNVCDCGAVAYKRDGSGWFCRECEIFVALIERLVDEIIQRRRDLEVADANPRRAYHRHYERCRRKKR
jgi:hypothetical protein